nr:odorant binding protein 10 [Trissolcus basalis]
MKKYMFQLLLLVTLLNVTVSMEDLESGEQSISEQDIVLECMHQEGLTQEEVSSAIKSGKYHKLNCLQTCVLTKLGLMRDGKFEVKPLSYFLKTHVNDIKKKIMYCSEKVSTQNLERCDIPLAIQNCLNNGAGDGEVFL